MTDIEFGLDTFGGVTRDAEGKPQHHAQVIRNIVDEGVLADQVGLDFFGVGEHHRRDFAVSSPEMVLAAVASRTERLRLGSAVTVLSSDDPVRVFERFATLDAVSQGRAEIVAGRGSFTESFPLFGFDLADYEELFEERLELLAALLKEEKVTWEGRTRAALTDQEVFPRTENGLTAWVGVGGSPESVVRTARHGFGLFLAIIGGPADRFAPYIDLFERAQDEFGCRGSASPSTRPDSSRRPTSRPARRSTRAGWRCVPRSVASAAGRRPRPATSSARSRAGRSTSARRRRSPGSWPAPSRCSGSTGST
ncbi:LLM class flavin-dependent oxidoreductase [Nocardioides sp. NPDC004968]|uniref:LLM class flavin-dependent oxidoreductase n=1 Tax=Nocardioides sp. NPDC004968 TaxID=3155894 RepID=UPI0033BB95D1